MNYAETVQFLFRRLPMFQRVGIQALKKDLTNINLLLDHFGRPEKRFKSIHIAGTNGKGSTAHFLAAMLMVNGYKIGLYTSPHYLDFRERIKINGNLISKKEVVQFVKQHKDVIHHSNASFFEVTVAMAFDCFARQQVDFAIIETGLGGRLDSTNVLHPELSIITNIGYDHQNMLGDTLPQIATEKAGIIKNRVPVIIGEYQEEVNHVFLQKAKQEKAPIIYADKLVHMGGPCSGLPDCVLSCLVKDETYIFQSDISGPFTHKNIRTAIAALAYLSETSGTIDLKKSIKALEKTKSMTHFIGRWEILQKEPTILADSAHNREGLQILVEAIHQFSYRRLHIILGTVNDKEPSYVFDILPKKATYYFAKAKIPRGMDAATLRDFGHSKGVMGKAYISVRKALSAAKLSAKKDDLIIVCGSIFVVAEVI